MNMFCWLNISPTSLTLTYSPTSHYKYYNETVPKKPIAVTYKHHDIRLTHQNSERNWSLLYSMLHNLSKTQTYEASPWIISSFVIRWLVLFKSCIRELILCDHSLRISFGSLCGWKHIVPPGRSILAKTTFEATRFDRNSSASWQSWIVGWISNARLKNNYTNSRFIAVF